MKNGPAVPAAQSARATSAVGRTPSSAPPLKPSAATAPASAIMVRGCRVRSSTAPTSGAATTAGASEAATSSPPRATSFSSSTARIGIATVAPPIARRSGVADAR
jgi:hypothetical protein